MPALSGGCLCDGVRFEIDEPLGVVGYCHCTRCQRRSGAAASAQVRVPGGALRFARGDDLVRWFQPAQGWAKGFCGTCGSALFARSPDGSQWSARLGALDPGHGLRPSFRQHVATAADWEPLPDDGLRRFEGPRQG